jgi:hypothetical protein
MLEPEVYFVYAAVAGNVEIAEYILSLKGFIKLEQYNTKRLIKKNPLEMHSFIKANRNKISGYSEFQIQKDIFYTNNDELIESELNDVNFYDMHNVRKGNYNHIDLSFVIKAGLMIYNEKVIRKYIDKINLDDLPFAKKKSYALIYDLLKTKPSIKFLTKCICNSVNRKFMKFLIKHL